MRSIHIGGGANDELSVEKNIVVTARVVVRGIGRE